MKFPKRTSQHIQDTAGMKIFQYVMPSEWIVREVSERDYGIDAYIELVPSSGEVSGELCSIQLKSSESLQWKNGKTVLNGIRKSTINYWMNLPVPVFLALTDTKTKELYFCPIKDQVRNNYFTFLNDNETMSAEFLEVFKMDGDVGKVVFLTLYYREKFHKDLQNYIRDLLLHYNEYYDFIIYNQGRDYFLDVERERQLLLVHIYNICKFMADFFNIKWTVLDLKEAYSKDYEMFKDSFCLMHEYTLTTILRDLEPMFISVLNRAKTIITETQCKYWEKTDFLLYNMCLNLNIERLTKLY